MSLLHSSTRRPKPLEDADCDHEISLVDHTGPNPVGSPAENESITAIPSATTEASDSSSTRDRDASPRKTHTRQRLHEQISKRKYKKYQDRGVEADGRDADGDEGGADEVVTEDGDGQEPANEETEDRGRTSIKEIPKPDSAIDVLYENQRGGFLCGIPLFSSRALGNLDPSAWTNIAQKTSATNITNAQVPDPSWKWAWKDWSINHENDVDEDGWEYSFAFAKQFSWHGPSWWNSFVRRRAWIRKRVRKNAGFQAPEAHRLNSDYFTVQPAVDRSRSRQSTTESKRYSIDQLASRKMEEPDAVEDIRDIEALMTALKHASIDREKLEIVENFIRNGGDELCHLKQHRHDILRMFIFQASRKILLAHLHKLYEEAAEELGQHDEEGNDVDSPKQRWLRNLEVALRGADEEVKKLEFWGDVKDLAETGETKGAVDESQGWNSRIWEGIDNSGPKDVLSNPEASATESCKIGAAVLEDTEKGKSKAKE
ncbi:Uncharacterized protein BP5553_05508 [Venustampulla echinocandica]|uniref:Peroxin/Ferlin domain-containing protein n=1 Tax=Venustampulla echinocandica TaxID=2656787 RepID=A0A370TRA5_9HELO|nr:Uncharacterized protein BP5553_05508 [Venustampulla echinocandica]RDL38075.1 Uncharacterized protein BP5553_05508 [Venustampulla echinocandica]